MDSQYQAPQDSDNFGSPQPHPYLHEPLLHISNVPPYVSDENLAVAFVTCGPFRPRIPRDGSSNYLSVRISLWPRLQMNMLSHLRTPTSLSIALSMSPRMARALNHPTWRARRFPRQGFRCLHHQVPAIGSTEIQRGTFMVC